MPELEERWQPALLDRLTDDEPDRQQESRDRRVVTLRQLRQCVLRDLSWLLNSTNIAAVVDLSRHPLVAESVINYGLPDLTGLTVAGLDVRELERAVRDAVAAFEPRILKHTLRVRAVSPARLGHPNALAFEISGQLWAEPAPEPLYLMTEVDLETGNVAVEEHAAAQGVR
jgi:type VI secretion system protein ImpF